MNLFIPTNAAEINYIKLKFLLFLSFFFLFILSISLFTGCSSSKRFTSEGENSKDFSAESNNQGDYFDRSFLESGINTEMIRILLDEYTSEKSIKIESPIEIHSLDKKLAVVNKNNVISFSMNQDHIELLILNKSFTSQQFILIPVEINGIINIDGKRYRGIIRVILNAGRIAVINQISLEDYVKGVMKKEMPLGKGGENYEALKAFSICVRTYAFTKLFNGKTHYDILPDTRDQVYGGLDGESEYSNKIVDETRNQILFYNNQPATIFYHSTCGGVTEKASNVFTQANGPYLEGITDGSPPNCRISPRYEWTENIPEYKIIERLFNSGHINSKAYSIKKISINSRFESGRVNELEILLSGNNSDDKSVRIYGNKIRSVIRSSDDKLILKSNYFEIKLSSNRTVMINGKGNGHGVGLCQWGSIGLSRDGKDYKYILDHYFPGTEIKELNVR